MGSAAFNVIIMHGHSDEWKKIDKMLGDLGFTARVLIREYTANTIFEHLRDIVWDEIHAAIILLSCDDLTTGQKYRARQNVVFELGYCFGAFDSLDDRGIYTANDALVIVAENGVELFSDIDGLKRIDYEKGRLGRRKKEIQEAITHSYKKASQYYRELR
ncbi:MAG TPA: nucleotide-binding protein [Panacibacter sp.]|nr:nucleotide-binding protein [Panacibacter sp.]HNP42838.1 nucleotide-binding protein [Panacibacter sp.]